MRSIMRFLVLGTVVGGLLTNGIQPAHADDELQVGTYKGMITLAIHSRAYTYISNLGQTFDDSVTINWFGEGNVDLVITSPKQGTIIISNLPVDIYDNGYVEFKNSAGNCYASVGIKARGNYAGVTLGLNFDPQQKAGTLSLIWNGLDNFDIVWDTVQGCWSKKMSDSQKIAIVETSSTIGQINLSVTKNDADFVSGDCRLPGWEGGGSVSNGSYAHIIDACTWWASKNGAQGKGGMEWTNK